MAFTPQQIADAYQQTVGAGTMSEADFVNAAMNQYGVSADQLTAARDVLLAPAPIAAAPSPTLSVAPAPVYGPEPSAPTTLAAPLTGGVSGITGALPAVGPEPTTPAPAAPALSSQPNRGLITDFEGTQYDVNTILGLADQISKNMDLSRSAGSVFGTQGQSIGFNYDEASRVLGRSATSRDQVALDMARELAKQGVTDIGQLTSGMYQPPDVELEAGFRTPDAFQSIYADGKLVGSPIDAGRSMFGSTYTGKGGTAYHVTIDPNTGKPVFTTAPIETSDLGTVNMLLTAASFIPGLTPFARLGQAALAASQGNPLGTISSLVGAAGGLGINLPTEVTDVMKYVNAADRAAKGDIVGAASTLVDSKDFRVASAAYNVIKAVDDGNPFAIFNSTMALNNAINASTGTPSGGTQAGPRAGDATSVRFSGGDELAFQAYQNAINAGMTSDEARQVAGMLTSPEFTSAYQDTLRATGDTNAALNAAVDQTGRTFTQAIPASGAGITTTDLGLEADKGEFAFLGPRKDVIEIKSDEANTPEEAAALARSRNAAASGFTFGGQEYRLTIPTGVGGEQIRRQADLQDIATAPTFNDAFSKARSLLGPNQTFEWQGKQYSTATFAERPDLAGTSVVPGATSTTAGAGRGSYAGFDAEQAATALGNQQTATAARAAETVQSTGLWNRAVDFIKDTMKLSSEAANDYLRNNPDSPFTQNVSTAMEAAGELQRNVAGGTALLLNNKPLADAFVKGGDDLIKLGQSIGTGPRDSQNWQTTLNLLNAADGWKEKLGVIAGRILDGNSGLGRQVEMELRQELPALFLGGGSARAILVASGLVDTADTAGNAALEAYDDAVRSGKKHDDALADARRAGAAAGATEATIQLTLGKLADLGLGKLDNIIAKGAGRATGETVTEGAQEGAASAAVDLALGRDININKAITEAIIGSAVGGGTSTTTTPVSSAQDISQVIAGGAPSVTAGAPTATAGDQTIATTVPTITAVAGPSTTVDAQTGVTTQTATDASTGVTTQTETDPNTGVNTQTTTDPNIGVNVQAQENTQTNITTETSIDANTGVNTQITTDPNTGINTQITVNTQTNVTTQVTTDTNTNTQTTVNTDPNTNTQVTTVVNSETGEIISETITEIPEGWTVPTIDIPGTTASTTLDKTAEKKGKQPARRLPAIGGGAGMLAAFGGEDSSLDPQFLKSRVLEGYRDPLAEMKQIQEEMEAQAMMQNIDPRLASILQQRMGAEQPMEQAQRFDQDIGALARVLSGQPEPAQNDSYYSYGQEDDIDQILGKRAYKEGGYVAPLMAQGGMTLPLMAKKGGALDHYEGRENFKEGKHVAGEGDGQSDDIPAWLADGEFVFPADVVSALGNGSTKAGTDKLYEMMHAIRDRARSKGPKDLPPPAFKSPLDYLKSGKRSAK